MTGRLRSALAGAFLGCLLLVAALEARAETVITLPDDQAYPVAGQWSVVAVPTGGEVRLTGDFVLTAGMFRQGDSLILISGEDGVLVLQDLFANPGDPSSLILAGIEIPLSVLAAVPDLRSGDAMFLPLESLVAPAAGDMSGGGGEMFGLVQVISWFVDRLDVVSEAQAAELQDQAPAVAAAPAAADQSAQAASPPALLEQVLAQMRIARELQILESASQYEAQGEELWKLASQIAEGGGLGIVALTQVDLFRVEGQLEAREAGLRRDLAIDAHEDRFGKRLVDSVYPQWRYSPAANVREAKARVAPEYQAEVRRYWRQERFAFETKALLVRLLGLAEEVVEGMQRMFEVGQVTLSDLLGAEQVAFQVRVRLAQREYDLRSAEAWLLAAEGQLSPDVLLQPGWR